MPTKRSNSTITKSGEDIILRDEIGNYTYYYKAKDYAKVKDGPLYYRDKHDNGSEHYWDLDKLYSLHREDGPAVIEEDGVQEWWYHGKQLPCETQKEFEQLIKMKAFW